MSKVNLSERVTDLSKAIVKEINAVKDRVSKLEEVSAARGTQAPVFTAEQWAKIDAGMPGQPDAIKHHCADRAAWGKVDRVNLTVAPDAYAEIERLVKQVADFEAEIDMRNAMIDTYSDTIKQMISREEHDHALRNLAAEKDAEIARLGVALADLRRGL